MLLCEELAETLNGIHTGYTFRKVSPRPSCHPHKTDAIGEVQTPTTEHFAKPGIAARLDEHLAIGGQNVMLPFS